MANENQNLTNPNDLVDIRLLDYFKQKLAEEGDTAYHKPSGGIPKSDLASDVQVSLGKADSAIQSNPVMTGAGASAAGAKGLVPAPAAGDNDKFLRGDGTWSDDLPRAQFVNNMLVFSSGGVFAGNTLVLS